MSKTVEFFFDYGSPYSYLANTRLGGIAARTGATVVYRPMLLGAVFKATGNASPANTSVQAKLSHGIVDLTRWARYYGVPFRLNPHFPINTLRVMRAAVACQLLDCFPRFHAAAFAAIWEQEQNLGEESVLRSLLERTGVDAREVMQRIETSPVKDLLRSNTEEAVERGVFGAPTFFVGDEMYWGNDRLLFVEQALGEPGTARMLGASDIGS